MSNEQTKLEALKQMLEFTSPKQLRTSIESMFHRYLLDADKMMPSDYKQVVEDRFLILQFLSAIKQDIDS